jgi:hypothetical protein
MQQASFEVIENPAFIGEAVAKLLSKAGKSF